MKKNYPAPGVLPGKIRTLFFLMSFAALQLNAQIELVKDLVDTANPIGSEFTLVHEVGEVVYFVSENDLWISDSEGNISKLKGFVSVSKLMNIDDVLLFFANDGVNGTELWRSNGTEEGTVLVKDILPGVSGPEPTEFCFLNGNIFFVATNGVSGREIWRTDGTPSGTLMVKDIMKGVGHSNASFLTPFGGYIYFAANDAIHGYELWRTDGTGAGTVLVIDIYPGKKSSAPQHITVSDGHLYFSARTEEEGEELWKSDGTAAGTTLLLDINPGAAGSYPKHFIDSDGTLYFAANNGVHGTEFWTSDGTAPGTSLIKDINPGKYNGVQWLLGIAGNNGLLYFVLGEDLYVTDGTEAGTMFMRNIGDHYSVLNFFEFQNAFYVIDFPFNSGSLYDMTLVKIEGTSAADVIVFGAGSSGRYEITGTSAMYFIGPDSFGDQLIWKSDGTAGGTMPFVNIATYTDASNPQNFVHFNSKLYFTTDSENPGGGLWSTDGTNAGTEQIASGFVRRLVAAGGLLFFDNNSTLWKSDGTPEGTSMVSAVNPSQIAAVGGHAYFSANTGGSGFELWKSDGTPEGTVVVKDINPGAFGSSPNSLTNVNGTLFFTAFTSAGEELWKSDGTEGGTVLVKDIIPGSSGSEPRYLTSFNNQLFFVARRYGGGLALYRSDGTNAGTVIIKEFLSEPVINFANVTVSGNRLYFIVRHTTSSQSLYQTDGTSAGTSLVRTFPNAYQVDILTEYHGKTHVLVRSAPGYETVLWATDGTAAGTSAITELEDNRGGNTSVVVDDILYFEGAQWLGRTDGTACGTFAIKNSGDLDVIYPGNLMKFNNKVIFSAYANQVGTELFSLDASDAPTADCEELASTLRSGDALSQDEDGLKGAFGTYPNPFSTDFQLTLDKLKGDRFDVVIYSLNGQVKARYEGLRSDETHSLGDALEHGLYFIRITANGKSETRRLVKR